MLKFQHPSLFVNGSTRARGLLVAANEQFDALLAYHMGRSKVVSLSGGHMRWVRYCLTALLLGCTSNEPTTPAPAPAPILPPPVASVEMQALPSMLVGETAQLTVVVLDASRNPLNRVVTFRSSDATIAEVDPAGKVAARQAGTATITATSEGKSAQILLIVRAYVPCQGPQYEAFCVSPEIYALVSVNDQPLPVHSPWGSGDWDYDDDAGTWQLTSWTISLYAEGTFTQATVERARSGATISDKSGGRYVRTIDSIEFTFNPSGRSSARVVGNNLIVQWTGGPTFTFERR
jgi:hypothetical protein